MTKILQKKTKFLSHRQLLALKNGIYAQIMLKRSIQMQKFLIQYVVRLHKDNKTLLICRKLLT